MEWVEIIEPRTKERMYANLTTGECVWEPPAGVPVKKTNENQWWELFDPNTSRFYYYNASSQKTVWHKPSNCDIIPLAKLQTLKQNTEVRDVSSGGSQRSDQFRPSRKESVATQTPSRTCAEKKTRSARESVSCESHPKSSSSSCRGVSTETQTSPVSSPLLSRRHHHHYHRHGKEGSGECQVVERQRSSRRACPSAGWHKRAGTQDSGRSSDSGSISLSRTSLEASLMGKLDSPRRDRESQDMKYPSLEPSATRKYREGSLKSLDKVTSPVKSDSLKANRQRSLDAERHRLFDYYHERPKEASLSRSLSFMQQRVDEDKSGSMTPQSRRKLQSSGSGEFKNDSLDSLCTPMIHRKIRSLETGKTREFGNRKLLDKLRDLSGSFNSDSSPSPSSPKCEFSSPFSTHDSGNSTLNEKDALIMLRGRCSADSSPHSQGDSGLATTGSRASQDSNPTKSLSSTRSSDKFDTSRSFDSTRGSDNGARGEKNSSDSTSESTAKNSSPSTNVDAASPLYGNVDAFKYAFDDKNESHLLPLQQYILEQAKLSGYRLADQIHDDIDSLHSDDEEESNGHDSDAFADDEGLSNQDSASSHDELDGSGYLKEDDHYRQFVGAHSSQSSRSQYRSVGSQDPRIEPEYVEAEYGSIYGALFGIGSVRPTGLSLSHTVSQQTSDLFSGSLRRKKDPSPSSQPNLYSPVLERRELFRDGCSTHSFRPMSISTITAASSLSPSSTHSQPRFQGLSSSLRDRRNLPTLPPPVIAPEHPPDGDIEKYAADHLAVHKKGIFRKNVSVRDMLSWSKDGLNKPMLPFVDKMLKKESCNLFRLIQIYMGDRKCKPDMTCNGVALDLCNMGWNKPVLRDELYLCLSKQTTENPRKESLRRGWELLAICLYFFPPSPKLQPHLEGYIKRHRDPSLHFSEIGKWPIHVQVSHYATVSAKRLERIGTGGRRPARKPSFEEVEQARLQIFRPSMFGNTLDEIMTVQRERFPHRKLPWIQTTLSEEVLRLQGASTEGIFRVPADVDEVNALKSKLDQWELGSVSDAHVPASLLKLWYRELYEPLIPDHLYEECVRHCTDPDVCVSIVHRLPELNKLVLCYLIRFLQIFSQPEVVVTTKMDAGNLSMVMAPNCLRCTATDTRTIFENTRKEMAFLRTLIQNLDTGFMEGVV